jgi:hypothetical protein
LALKAGAGFFHLTIGGGLMRKSFTIVVGAALAAAAAFVIFGTGLFSEEAEGIEIDEVDSFQLPFKEVSERDYGRICQDLAWDGTYLWVINSDDLQWHSGSDAPEILKIHYDEAEGNIEDSFNIPGSGPLENTLEFKGLAWDGTYLLLAWGHYTPGKIFVLNPASAGSFVSSFNTPCAMPYGLAYQPGDPGSLWTVSNADDNVYQMRRDNGSFVSSFSIASALLESGDKVRAPAGLGYDSGNGYIWVAAFGKNDKLLCYTTGGSLVGSISAQTNRPHPFGVTWDDTGEYLWYVDACTDTFYRISLLFD